MPPKIAIVGGGLAGLAAAVALVEHDCQVEVFEARRSLGGRAGSYVDETGALLDHCQHVAMGCCTNLLDLCRRTSTAELLEHYDTLHFFGPDGKRSDFCPWRGLPAPLHLAPPLFGLNYLSLHDKLGIARAMLSLVRCQPLDLPNAPTVLDWLKLQRQTPHAMERFWQVVLVSALGESLDRASLPMARKVFLDGFLAHPDACQILVPKVALAELYDRHLAQWLESRGAVLHLATPVAAVLDPVTGVELAGGVQRQFDLVVVAAPWRRIHELLPPHVRLAIDPQQAWPGIGGSPISSIHLWLDRAITELPHAVLVGRLSQWLFARPATSPSGHYYQVVISASRELSGRGRQSIVEEVMADLTAVFPLAKEATLLRWQLISQPDAVFSVRPGLTLVRPRQQTPIPGLVLAGDWTATGWPATMEGAVRSGYLAAEAVLTNLRRPAHILVPDLPRSWLLRLLGVAQ